MIDTFYIERELKDHPRTEAICKRFPAARKIYCERYTEVFNPKAQNFRLQKSRPAMILARKHGRWVLPTPAGYGVGGDENYYFSHMLNCLYDCRYCFLQGMYRSANYVCFLNYEDCDEALAHCLKGVQEGAQAWFFSGYDCDSLALEPVTGFAAHFLPFFRQHPTAWLELRTKSTQIRSLLAQEPMANCVVAFSLNPAELAQALEHKAPTLMRRLDAMQRLVQQGWLVGLRFDPLLFHEGYQKAYQTLFAQVFERIDGAALHSASLGVFRLPRSYFRKMVQLYPEERLFAGKLEEKDGQISYSQEQEEELLHFCRQTLLQYMPEERLFHCSV